MTELALLELVSARVCKNRVPRRVLLELSRRFLGSHLTRYNELRQTELIIDQASIGEDDTALWVALRALYREWLRDAEGLAARISEQKLAELEKQLSELKLGIARTTAYLSSTPEGDAETEEMARRGELIPLEVVRNELRNRVHS